jgi:hypothetical protein
MSRENIDKETNRQVRLREASRREVRKGKKEERRKKKEERDIKFSQMI